MQKIKIIFVLVVSFLLCLTNVKATTYEALLTGNGVTLREGPSTTSAKIFSLARGTILPLVDQNPTNNWYKVYYEGNNVGYVYGNFVSVKEINENTTGTPTNSCEQEMSTAYTVSTDPTKSNEGFPSSYWGKLCKIKESHPNWVFHAIDTGLNWSDVVNNESNCLLSAIESTNSKAVDYSCTNIFKGDFHPASNIAVSHYMDPRNFISEIGLFQFESLHYNASLSSSYLNGIYSILKNADFYTYHVNRGLNFADTLNTAGNNSNVNSIFLASRILQELGTTDTEKDLYRGVYPGYENLYNFYNFGVSDSCVKESGRTYCGLNYAQKKGWNSVYNALYGGASQLSSDYIGVGQYNGYLQKFNVFPNNVNVRYNHQYMANISAPSYEATDTYKAYKDLGLINSAFDFYIPVYNNMSTEINNTNNGSVPDNTNQVVATPISTIVTSSGYRYSSNRISNIASSTNISTVKSNLESISGTNSVTIKDQNGNNVSDGLIGTGYTVSISNANSTENLIVVINGDTSGDGIINALDLLQVQKNILGTYSLTGVYSEAGDTSEDGKINALDLLQIQKNILGTYTIGQ